MDFPAPSLSLGFPDINLGITPSVLTGLFFLTLIVTILYTLALFAHWHKHSPSKLESVTHGIVFAVGTAIFLVILLGLLPMYAGLNP